MNLFMLQNPLIRPAVGPDSGDTVTGQLEEGLGEIIAEDTNNIIVQVKYTKHLTICSFDNYNAYPCILTCVPPSDCSRDNFRGVPLDCFPLYSILHLLAKSVKQSNI